MKLHLDNVKVRRFIPEDKFRREGAHEPTNAYHRHNDLVVEDWDDAEDRIGMLIAGRVK